MQSAISGDRPIALNRSLSVTFAAVAQDASKATLTAARMIRIFPPVGLMALPIVAGATMLKIAAARKPTKQELP